MDTAIALDTVLNGYRKGLFLMADSRDKSDLFWVSPKCRGVMPIADLHIPRSLHKKLSQRPFKITYNQEFSQQVRQCSLRPREADSQSWINIELASIYAQLHWLGYAHSLEVWQDDQLVGGLFGIALGGAFFGESMYSKVTDASKVGLCYLVAKLWAQGFTLLDTQFITPHLAQFGASEISAAAYQKRLDQALKLEVSFHRSTNPDEELAAFLAARKLSQPCC